MKRVFARLGGFATSSAVSGVAALAIVPILVHAVGALQWAAVAVGQSVGSIASIVLGLGWGVSGAATVAARPRSGAALYLRESLVTRGVLLLPVTVVAVLITWFVAPAARFEAAATAVAFTALGFSSNWFFIGIARPRSLLLRETLPRTVGSLLGAVLVLAGLPLVTYPLLALLGCGAAVLLTARLASGTRLPRPVLATTGATLRNQAHAAVTGIVSASYINLPTVVVAVLAPTQTPVIALADRLFKFANAGLQPINQTLQGWIPYPDPAEQDARIRRGVRIAALVALAAAVAFAVLAQPAADLLSGGRIPLGLPVVLAFAATLAFTTLSQTVGVACLTSLGAIRSVAASAVAGAVLGVVLLVPGARLLGATGASVAEAAAECVVIGYQLLALRKRMQIVVVPQSRSG